MQWPAIPRLRRHARASLSVGMHVSFNLAATFDAALKTAAATAGFDAADFSPEVRTADPKHGDFQANGDLPYAKRTKQNPRALAEKLVAALPADVREATVVTVAGPGFINFTLQPAALQAWLQASDPRTTRLRRRCHLRRANLGG